MSRKMMFVSSQRNAGGSTPRQGNINIHVVIAANDADRLLLRMAVISG